MLSDTFLECYRKEFPFELTEKQVEVVHHFFDFLFSNNPMGLFMLRGYAGTGKTLLVSALVRLLHKLHRDVVLLAPTGRASKVFSAGAGFPAYTIHKQIYRQKSLTSEDAHFDLALNQHKKALFIVDESSMISARSDLNSLFGSGNVLHDLLQYVYRSKGCRIMFVGDNAQLPPVGDEESPALMPSYLRQLGFDVSGFQLTEVMRQEQESGILYNATQLRRLIKMGNVDEPPVISFQGFQDIQRVMGSDIVEQLQTSYDTCGQEQTMVLTRSNKQANIYNKGIRSTFFGREEGLQRGDMIMVVRNNYFWTEQLAITLKNQHSSETVPMDFIANGDIAEVTCVHSFMELYDFHFADVDIRFPDYDDFEMSHVRVLLDVLDSDGPALPADREKQLFVGVSEDYMDERSKKERMKKIRLDPNYNALQIKYAYAVTCHKAQGGQWKHVFLDQGWLPPDGADLSYHRWLYTAFTRPTQNLYLISWPEAQTQK